LAGPAAAANLSRAQDFPTRFTESIGLRLNDSFFAMVNESQNQPLPDCGNDVFVHKGIYSKSQFGCQMRPSALAIEISPVPFNIAA
jgi:hypothetical protein